MSSTTFAVDENNDLYINRESDLDIVTGLDSVLQNCAHAAKTLLGECVLNIDEGLPYFQVVWNGVPNLQQFDAALRQAILNVPDVQEIESLDLVLEGEVLTYTIVIVTEYGTGVVNNG